jgi:hypothetical protein
VYERIIGWLGKTNSNFKIGALSLMCCMEHTGSRLN